MNRRNFLKSMAALSATGIIPFVRAEKVSHADKPERLMGWVDGILVVRNDQGRLVPYKNEVSIEWSKPASENSKLHIF